MPALVLNLCVEQGFFFCFTDSDALMEHEVLKFSESLMFLFIYFDI